MADGFRNFFNKRLKEPLPGSDAQFRMAPEPVSTDSRPRKSEAPPHAIDSSVLVLVYAGEDNNLKLVFTLRTTSINHGGQISFPGGRSEPGESSVETALREAEEEIGVNPDDISIVGSLSTLYTQVSNNEVTPVVGFLDYVPELKINPDEVEEVFSTSLVELADKNNIIVEKWQLHGKNTYRVPFWNIHRVPLWGVSAMILSEFMELYGEFKSQKTKT